MCGIAGIANLDGSPADPTLLRRMTDAIAHRGPDGEGQLVDGAVGIANRRLAIIDLSDAGRQPMASENGRIAVVHNGEIYNFRELRVGLEQRGHRFRSATDTEVVVHAWEEQGPACVDEFNGMFAFAVWDAQRGRLDLVRDRYGVKPLYWWCDGRTLLFASEIKALLVHPRVRRGVCAGALGEYFTFQNVFSDRTLFEGVRLLQPGCRLSLDLRAGTPPAIERWWDYRFTADLDGTSEEDLAELVSETFAEAVTRQLVSDVPIGGYLSGGMDSSSIVAVATRSLPRLSSFTAGFDLSSASGLEIGFDERRDAESLANLMKTEHYEVVLHAGDMEWVLPDLVWHLEDLRVGQCYPNFYVARLASKFVKVVLSGAGGDELFGGYPWRYYQGIGSDDRDDYLRRYYGFWQRLVSDEDKARLFRTETQRAIGDESSFDAFRGVFAGWDRPFESDEDIVDASLYFELKTFLHGLLVVEDKLSMAHSLETRVPFLDNRLVDLALRIPARAKIHSLGSAPRVDENVAGKRHLYAQQSSDGKAVLRRAMAGIVPGEVAGRTKQGFSAPDASWFRGESLDYINRLLGDPKALIYEYLEPAYVRSVLDQHCSGRANRRLLIWSFLCFEWWCRRFLDGAGGIAT